MRRVISLGLFAVLCAPAYAVELIPLNIKRIAKDHYQSTDELVNVLTKNCLEFAYVDNALLRYEPYGLENTLTFSSGAVCDVRVMYDRSASERFKVR